MEELELEQIVRGVVDRLIPHLKKVEEKGYFSIAEAALFIGCSAPHIRRHVTGGNLSVSNIGTNDGPDYRISRADLVAWMEKRKAEASPPPRRKKGATVNTPLPFSPHRRPSKNAAATVA